jgi:hypothetical protein
LWDPKGFFCFPFMFGEGWSRWLRRLLVFHFFWNLKFPDSKGFLGQEWGWVHPSYLSVDIHRFLIHERAERAVCFSIFDLKFNPPRGKFSISPQPR